MASLHSVTTTRVPIDYALKPATMPWSDAYAVREPATADEAAKASRGSGAAEDAAKGRNDRRLRPADGGNRLIILPPSAQAFVQLYKSLGGGWQEYQAIPAIRRPQPAVIAAFRRALSRSTPP